MKDNRWIICPMCARSRKLFKDNRDIVSFVMYDVENGPCIDFRDTSGGRGSGFPRIGELTLEQMKDDPQYHDILVEIKAQAERIAKFLEDVEDAHNESTNDAPEDDEA